MGDRLWSQVVGGANVVGLFNVLLVIGKSKAEICDFVNSVVVENVSGFQVSVDHLDAIQLSEPLEYVPEDLLSVLFLDSALGFEEGPEVATVTELCDDVGVVFALVVIEHFEHVLGVALLESFQCGNFVPD